MKNIFYLVLSLLLCAILAGGVFIVTQGGEDVPNTSQSGSVTDSTDWGDDNVVSSDGSNNSGNTNNGTNDSGNTDSGANNSGNTDNGNTESLPTLKGLKIPKNEASFIAQGLTMQKGAQLSKTGARALQFTCNVTATLYNEVKSDVNKTLAILAIPTSYFDKVNPENYTYIDWITAFNQAGETSYKYHELDDSNFIASGSGYIVRYQMNNISYGAVNQSITCLGVLATTSSSGTVTYKYSALPTGETYQSNGRSLAYLAAASLNANTLGMETFDSTQIAIFKGYINESVDKANGLAEPVNDGSMYAFTVTPSGTKRLSVGEFFTIETTIAPKVNVPIWYRSSDESIVEVDDNGVVTAKGKGTAVIGVYVAGENLGVTVTVS